MKSRTHLICGTLLATMLLGGATNAAETNEPVHDASADAAGSFLESVLNSRGLLLRVVINENGEEDTSTATMRMVTQDIDVQADSNLSDVFAVSAPIDGSPQLSADVPVDSSTWGWFNWRHNWGWSRPYYYYSYRPSAYYYGSYYNYSPYYYSNSYYGNYGYRYYYYGCGW